MTAKGVIAAGHPQTVHAAAVILEEGGNAFDAVLAAILTACVVEPVLASLGGGGFLMARPGENGAAPVLYDFFTQTPKNRGNGAALDFHPIDADFGTVTQEFHIGMASMATPGTVKGLFQAHRDLCSMPMARIIEPAARLARDGFTVNNLQAYLFRVVGPIYMSTAASRGIFCSPRDADGLMGEGETMTNPDFAAALEALAREGEDLFYRGEIAATIAEDCRTGGGILTREDFQDYRSLCRSPLALEYRGASILTNPPPSTGGILVAFALELMKDLDLRSLGAGTVAYLERLAQVMDLTNNARVESELHDADESAAAARLLDPAFLSVYRDQVLSRPRAPKGTTHVSVIDARGNAAALTLSNGEGAGYIAPGTGIMINNMLGEEDINPKGFHQWPVDTRLCSMMAPSIALEPGGRITALGSGGSNRIRTAILQVLVNLLDFRLAAGDAVRAPRIHHEGGLLNIEHGFGAEEVTALQARFPETRVWEERNLFFGGVHVARFDGSGGGGPVFEGAGDPRRGGAGEVV